MRYFLMFINFLFILVSIAGIVAGVLLMNGKDDNYLKFCEPCKQFNMFLIIVFAALLVFSFTGFCALWKRNSCMLVVYGFFLVIFFLGATCIVVVVFMIHDGRFDKRLEKAWQEEVSQNDQESDALCKFENDFKCSGWDVQCPASFNGTHNISYVNYTATEKINCPDCSHTTFEAQIGNHNVTTDTCHAVMKKDVDKYFYILLGSGLGLMALTLISIVISCKVRVEYEVYQEFQERF
eukprot:257546_1